MHLIAAFLGIALLATGVADALRTVVVARHGKSLPAVTRLFYRLTWLPYAAGGNQFRSKGRREAYLGIYGPLSLLLLLGFWAASMITAFALLRWSLHGDIEAAAASLANDLYTSAATFFTVGAGDPQTTDAKFFTVLEAGCGFTFLGLVIGYLPVLYQSFSSRELRILLLDAWAGSPPSAAQFVLRCGNEPDKLEQRLADWEEWALDLLQTHLSYPMLAFYRSQHTNQSWLATLTTVVDVSAFLMTCTEGGLKLQAEFTFAAGRHAHVHTASIFRTRPLQRQADRLSAADFERLCSLTAAGPTAVRLEQGAEVEMTRLRAMYEPYASALGTYFRMELPSWLPAEPASDNWQVSSWRES